MNGVVRNGVVDDIFPAPPADPIDRPSTPPPPPLDPIPPPPPTDIAAPPPPLDGSFPPPPPPDHEAIASADDRTDAAPPVKKKKTGWGSQPKATPLSVEELLRKKREADEAASKVCPTLHSHNMRCKLFTQDSTDALHRMLLTSSTIQPKFLSRAEREKLALEKRAREVEDQQKSKSTATPPFRNGINGSAHLSNGDRGTSDPTRSSIPTGPRAFRQGDVPTGPAAMRSKEPNKGYDTAPSEPPRSTAFDATDSKSQRRPADEDKSEKMHEALIKQRYMGADQNVSTFSANKKRRRTTEKKFNFEWNTEEDTSPDYNPIYNKRAEANFYGRGRLGGFADDF